MSVFLEKLPLTSSVHTNYGTLRQLETVTPEEFVKPATTVNKAAAFARDLFTLSRRDDATREVSLVARVAEKGKQVVMDSAAPGLFDFN